MWHLCHSRLLRQSMCSLLLEWCFVPVRSVGGAMSNLGRSPIASEDWESFLREEAGSESGVNPRSVSSKIFAGSLKARSSEALSCIPAASSSRRPLPCTPILSEPGHARPFPEAPRGPSRPNLGHPAFVKTERSEREIEREIYIYICSHFGSSRVVQGRARQTEEGL